MEERIEGVSGTAREGESRWDLRKREGGGTSKSPRKKGSKEEMVGLKRVPKRAA